MFKASMFDFDGTVTEKGQYGPSSEMASTLVRLAKKMPIAFCTGRQLESFESHGLNYLQEMIGPGDLENFYENLFLFGENGSIGYKFNTVLDRFDELYRVVWPEEFYNREELRELIAKEVEGIGKVYYQAHKVVIVVRTIIDYLKAEKEDIPKIYQLAREVFDKISTLLAKINPSYNNFVHVGNAGIGVVITPANGDKNNAIRRFADHLRQSRGYSFDNKLREILIVGDQPQKGGNDHFFLKGEIGTPYSVGEAKTEGKYPMEVVHDGKRLFNSAGTLYLIRQLL